ncbi:LysE family transporter [Burkholderia sp. A1]|uniref:LysE/ArgO family amino acid transporter n=1 Tax=Burkholderia sp. A1 TaxID=148446 RepID=UPI0004699E3F|nr:LysE family transporter [Burkholderia sp. A1]
MPSLLPFIQGLTLEIGLIIAVGPKDAYVIRQSLVGRHLGVMLAICVGSDVVLIALGMLGIGSLVSRSTWLMIATLVGGSLYMAWHGAVALRAAILKTSMPELGASQAGSLSQVARATAVLSFLNPLAILDSAVLIGAIGGTRPPEERLAFALGAVSASLIWFVVLISGCRLVAPLFRRSGMWRALDAVIATIMFVMAASTIHSAFSAAV